VPFAPKAAEEAAPAAAPSAANTLPRVIVTGTRENEDNYRVPTLDSVGPLGATPIIDLPYSIAVLPQDLIENSQAVNFKDVSKYLPLVAYQEQQGPDILRPQTRGMQGGNFQNTKLDGMTMFITVAMALEQFQQIEVVNGLSAFLYGPANPSGMFNFVSKRPTDYDLRELSASYNSDSIGTVKADLGGRIDKNGVFSYRLNALYGSGDGYVDLSHQRRAGRPRLDIRPGAGRAGTELQRLLAHRTPAIRGGSPTGRRSRCRLRIRSGWVTDSHMRASICVPAWRVRASNRTWAAPGI
jgi:iron complex outermembrane receptor protein